MGWGRGIGGGGTRETAERRKEDKNLTLVPRVGDRLKVNPCNGQPWQIFYYHHGFIELVDWGEYYTRFGWLETS